MEGTMRAGTGTYADDWAVTARAVEAQETVTITRERALRMWLLLNDIAEYRYERGLPADFVAWCDALLVAEDRECEAWGVCDD
jgi:hypothetical protein